MRFSFLVRFFISSALLSLFINTSCPAQKPYALVDTTIIHRLDAYAEVFIDPTNTITIDKVVKQDFQNRFQPSNNNLKFGYLKSAIWLKVKTIANSPGTHWYLEIPAPFLEYVDFYQLTNNGTWNYSMSGYYRKHNVRVISHTGHVLPLQFLSDSSSTVYIKISGRSPKTFPLYVLEKEKFYQKVRYEDVGYGIFYGILIVMFFYNLLLYLTLKQTNYLLYICTIVCTLLIFSSASGYGGKFIWPDSPNMNFLAGRMSLGMMVIFLSVFTIRFLEVKRYSKIMYNALVTLIVLPWSVQFWWQRIYFLRQAIT